MNRRTLRILGAVAFFSWLATPMALCDVSTPPDNQISDKQSAKYVSNSSSSKKDSSSEPSSRKQILHELKDVHHAMGQIQKNANGLLAEYNRSDLRIFEYGDFIENYMDDKPVPFQESLYPYGFQNFGNTGTVQGPPLPPRKQWVQHYMSNMKELLALAQSELKDVFSVAGDFLSKDDSAQCDRLMGDLKSAIEKVERLTALDKPDKGELKKTISNIIDDAHLLQLTAKKSVRAIASKK